MIASIPYRGALHVIVVLPVEEAKGIVAEADATVEDEEYVRQ